MTGRAVDPIPETALLVSPRGELEYEVLFISGKAESRFTFPMFFHPEGSKHINHSVRYNPRWPAWNPFCPSIRFASENFLESLIQMRYGSSGIVLYGVHEFEFRQKHDKLRRSRASVRSDQLVRGNWLLLTTYEPPIFHVLFPDILHTTE